jgi:hypothetical protein
MSAADSRASADRRLLHHHEARPFQMLDEAFRHDSRHHLGGVMDALAPAVA